MNSVVVFVALFAVAQAACPTDKTLAKCMDTDAIWCPAWQKTGECDKNADWMTANCQKSCCPTLCAPVVVPVGVCPAADKSATCRVNLPTAGASCETWATTKDADGKTECDKNPAWMNVNCMQSCCSTCQHYDNKCPVFKRHCHTKHSDVDACSAWAKAGECNKNPAWMNTNCMEACCPACAAKAPARVGAVAAPVVAAPVMQYAVPQQYFSTYATAAAPVARNGTAAVAYSTPLNFAAPMAYGAAPMYGAAASMYGAAAPMVAGVTGVQSVVGTMSRATNMPYTLAAPQQSFMSTPYLG